MDIQTALQQSLTVEAFIEALDQAIPDCHPRVTDTDREIWINVGKRNLVTALVQQMKLINEQQQGYPPNVL